MSNQGSTARSAAVVFIFVTVVLDMLAVGIIIPVLPKLVEQFLHGDTARAAEIYGLFGGAWALMQFFFSPLLGAVSDRYGRRPVILLSCLGLGADYLLMALAPALSWLFVGRLISGITAASFTTAGAYIADVTPPEKRAGAFGLLGAAWGVGFVLGPAAGGLLGGIDPRLPFWAAGALALLNAAYGFFVLPESLPPERRVAAVPWSKANPLGALRLLRSHPELSGLASMMTLYFLGHQVLPSVCVLYAGYRYGWEPTQMGTVLAAVGVCNIFVQALIVKPFVARFGERRSLLTGFAFGVAGFVIYGLAPTGALFWVGVPVFAGIGLVNPAAQALMTRHVQPQEQGQLQGANGAIMGLTGIFGPALFTLSFAYAIDPHRHVDRPGVPFLIAALLTFGALLLALRVARPAAPTPAAPAPLVHD